MSDMNIRLGLMPVIPTHATGELTFGSYNIDGVGARIEHIIEIEETGTLTHLGFRYRGTSGALSAGNTTTQLISLQGVDASTGQSDGLIKTSATFRPKDSSVDPTETDWSKTWQWVQVPSVSVTLGQLLAIVIEYHSGPIDPPTSIYTGRVIATSTFQGRFPYSAWTSNILGRTEYYDGSVVGYRLTPSGGSNQAYGWPIKDLLIDGYSGGAQRALRFSFDTDWNDSYKIAGCTWVGQVGTSSNQQYSMRLYEGTSEIGRTTVDSDHSMELTERDFHMILFDEATLPELTSGTVYRLAIVPELSTTECILDTYECESNFEQAAFPGRGAFYYSERSGAGSGWTDYPNRRPLMDLIVSEWGAPLEENVGVHIKVTPKYNDPIQVQHADDQIENNTVEVPSGSEPHEFPGVPIGSALESYSGYKTVEVFKDPDAARSIEYMIHPEQDIEDLKYLAWTPWEEGTFEIVFRLRAASGSAVYKEVIRHVRVILPP
jgi:hypothetical protein